jgi:predicted ATPase
LPVLELLRNYLGIKDTDDTVSRREKVRAALDELDPALQDTLPYLFGLFGIVEGPDLLAQMDAQIKRQRTLDTIKRIVVRTDGNPFFIEEIVQALFHEGALVRNGVVKVTRSLSQLRLPPTVQGILASRIDRQPGEHKQLLQTLAVIGRESSLGLMRQVDSHQDTQLEQMLADLQSGEFIYARPAATSIEYVFKHALTQEVAYNSLLIERRKQLHESVGLAVESIFADQLDDQLTARGESGRG